VGCTAAPPRVASARHRAVALGRLGDAGHRDVAAYRGLRYQGPDRGAAGGGIVGASAAGRGLLVSAGRARADTTEVPVEEGRGLGGHHRTAVA
jgi:hypothetical protein